jgi:GH18 family chitinase
MMIGVSLMIAFETNKRNTNVDHTANENRFTNDKSVEKGSYVSYYVNWSGWHKTHIQLARKHFYYTTKIC